MPSVPTGPNGSDEPAPPLRRMAKTTGTGRTQKKSAAEGAAGAVAEAAGEGPQPPRYTRRRLLILGGAAAAGVAATAAGIRVWGGSGSSSSVGRLVRRQPSASGRRDFPVLSVEPAPDVPPEDWVLKVDGLVERPLTIDRATWSGLQRLNETADFECVKGWTVDNVRWGGVAPSVLLDQAGVRPEAGVRGVSRLHAGAST